MRQTLLAAMAILAAACCPALADYPTRPLRLIVPFSAGSATDVLARALADALTPRLGQPVIVENLPGANGSVGTVSGLRSAPDGHTLIMVGTSTGAVNFSAYKAPAYDPRKDVAPVALIADSPFVLVAGKHAPAKTMGEFVAYAKTRPKGVVYSYGSGSLQLCAALAVSLGGFEAIGVAYRGVPQVMADLIGGRLDLTVADLVNGLEQARAGQVTALGVTSAKRTPLAPDIPSLEEAGLAGYDLTGWFGIGAPPGTPSAIVARLDAALRGTLADPALKKRFENGGFSPRYERGEDFARFIAAEVPKWARIFRDAGMEPQ